MFALLVPSWCDKSGTSWYHLVTRSMTVTDLLHADDIRFVGTTCCESLGLIHWSKDNQHNCKRDKLSIVKVGTTCLEYKVRFNSL